MVTAETPSAPGTDFALVAALRGGDEAAFLELVHRHQALMLRVARGYVHDPRTAEDVVQETWVAVLEGIDRFEGRASVKTWIFRILVKRSLTRAARDRRQVPFSALAGEDQDEGPTVDPARFLDGSHPRWPGHWAAAPQRWDMLPEARLLSRETTAVIRAAIAALPARQRTVIVLRDIGGFSADEVCASLDISEANQRVLLHRARARVRAALEQHLE